MTSAAILKTTVLLLVTFTPLSLVPTDCSKCDCSHFPISDPACVKCCFEQKGTVAESSGDSITVVPILGDRKQTGKRFRIQKTTKINGELKPGATATVYYHTVDGQDIATRVDGAGYAHGSLVPADLPSPPDTCEEIREDRRLQGLPIPPPVPGDAMRIFFGDSEGYSTEHRLIVWKIGDEDILVLQKTDSGVSVSAKVRGPDGQLEAQIVDNEFFINPRDSFRIPETGKSSLVVVNSQGQRVLEMEFLNPHAIKILGTFFGPGGEKITIGEHQQEFVSHGSTLISSHSCFGGGSHGTIELTPTGILVR